VLNIVCQLLGADAGQVQLMGEPLSPRSRGRIGLCAQDCALYPDLLPAENLEFFARLHGLPAGLRRQRVDELMQRFELAPHAATPVGRLSGGWRQRLHLAVALVHGPELLVLDEPTAAVDVAARLGLWTLIEDLRRSGTTILMTTHQLAEAERLCSRVALMRDGRVAAIGSVPELLARVPAQAVAMLRTRDPEATRRRAQTLGWAVREHAGQGSHLACLLPYAASLREVVQALDGDEIAAVSVQPVSLEDAYLEVMGGASSETPAPA
jgi:ABC-2 type transport system ATP-binding protein